MRPLSTRAKSESAGVARARMLIKAELWWLRGFPISAVAGIRGQDTSRSPAEEWIVVTRDPERAGPMKLERRHLSRATHTIKKLAGEFPRALPRIVGDARRWVDTAHQVIDLLKPMVHRGEPPPANLFAVAGIYRSALAHAAAEVVADQPALVPLVAAASWSLALSDRARPAVTFLRRHAAALVVVITELPDRDGLVTTLRLADLAAAEGERRVAPLVAWLSDPRVYQVPLRGGAEYAEQAVRSLAKRKRGKKAAPLPTPPVPTVARELRGWVDWLSGQDSPTRRRALQLFELIQPAASLGEWHSWWQRMTSGVERARGIAAGPAPDRAELARLHARLHKLRKKVPVSVEHRGLFEVITREAADAAASRHREVVRALAALPEPAGAAHLRAAFLAHWNELAAPRGAADRVRRLCAELASYLAGGGRLDPWAEIVARWAGERHFIGSVDDDLIDDATEPRDVVDFFRALVRLDRTGSDPIAPCAAQRLLELVQVTHDPAVAATLLPALTGALGERWVSTEVLGAAVALSRDDRPSFALLVEALVKLEQGWQRPGAVLTAMVTRFAGAPGMLRRLCIGVDLHRVVRCGRKLAVLELGATSPSARAHASSPEIDRYGRAPAPPPRLPAADAELPEWASGYPAALAAPLAALASVDDAAATTAARLLGRGFVDPLAIAGELAAIAARLPDAVPQLRARLETRKANLEQRLAAPPPPLSPRRIARLTDKLERTIAVTVLDDWERRLDAALALHLPHELGIDTAPDWLLGPETLDLVTPIAELESRDRRLAYRLLALRSGPPPWDLRDHPANRRFLEQLVDRGVDIAPWLDGIGVVARTAADGRKVELAFESDPLEVFQMGGHFETCLSPGGCNYFSVFANAADINKRVVYARDDQGKVVGRCLLALTGQGELLAFHPYAHDPKLGFAELMAELVIDLADRMGVVIAVAGEVPTLVASDWYDDGPVDVAGRFGLLAEGSAFRRALPDLPPGELVDRLTAELAPRSLDELVLPMILGLPEIMARPELVVPLVPILDRADGLPDDTRLRAANLLVRSGAGDAAVRLFGDRAAGYLERTYRRHRWLDTSALELLVDFAPRRALAVLRATRPRGVRSWQDESDAERLLAAGRATEALYRPRQAAALYRRAAAGHGSDSAKRDAKQRLIALESEAEG